MTTHTHTQQNCKFCGYYPTDKKVCSKCIKEHRPRISGGWLIFWFLFAGIGALVYYFWKKSKQDEWDRENL